MNRQSNPLRAATILIAVSALLLIACGQDSALDAHATVPVKMESHPSAPDPALDRLEAVTHHG